MDSLLRGARALRIPVVEISNASGLAASTIYKRLGKRKAAS
jgi:hypothetical protein